MLIYRHLNSNSSSAWGLTTLASGQVFPEITFHLRTSNQEMLGTEPGDHLPTKARNRPVSCMASSQTILDSFHNSHLGSETGLAS